MNQVAPKPRPLYKIAKDIRKCWKEPDPYAYEYVKAMAELTNITDKYISEDGEGIVLGFLCNCAKWRGEDARRIKAELNAILKEVGL